MQFDHGKLLSHAAHAAQTEWKVIKRMTLSIPQGQISIPCVRAFHKSLGKKKISSLCPVFWIAVNCGNREVLQLVQSLSIPYISDTYRALNQEWKCAIFILHISIPNPNNSSGYVVYPGEILAPSIYCHDANPCRFGPAVAACKNSKATSVPHRPFGIPNC